MPEEAKAPTESTPPSRLARWLTIGAALSGALSAPSAEPESTEAFGNDDSVQQCLEIMREVSAEHRARSRHLDTKTGTIAGFCATVLTLNVTLGRPLLTAKLSSDAHSAIRILFLVGSLALGAAAAAAVAGVLRPMGVDNLDVGQIDDYSNRPKVTTPPDELRMTWLRTLTEMTISERAAGNAKAFRSKLAVLLLVLGLVAVAGEAITLFFAS
jgi:hypothetical protein